MKKNRRKKKLKSSGIQKMNAVMMMIATVTNTIITIITKH